MTKQYRKKPVEIEAMLLDGNATQQQAVLDWVNSHEGGDAEPDLYLGGMAIHTLEGTMHAAVGDYIIKGVQGEFYPCKPDIFHETYEEA